MHTRLSKLSVLIVLLLAVAALAQSPATRPAGAPGPGLRPYPRPLGPGALRLPADEPVAWEEVARFFQENSPNRWEMFETLAEEQKQESRRRMIGVYRTILPALKGGDQATLDLFKKRIALEDEIFGLRMEAMRKGIRPLELRDKLREKGRELVRLDIAEREARIQRLRAALEHEEKRLEQDKQNIDRLVEQHLRDIGRRGPAAGPEPRRRPVPPPEGRGPSEKSR